MLLGLPFLSPLDLVIIAALFAGLGVGAYFLVRWWRGPSDDGPA